MDYKIVGIPEFVPSEDKFLDTSKQYVLPDGYLYEYILQKEELFTNYADPSSEDWKGNSRIRSVGEIADNINYIVTGFIPCKVGDIITVKNADAIYDDKHEKGINWNYYDSEKKCIATYSPYSDTSEKIVWNEEGEVEASEIGYINGNRYDKIAFIRITLRPHDNKSLNDIIITVNEKVAYSENGIYSWARTEQYVPESWYSEIINASMRVRELEQMSSDTISFLVCSDMHMGPDQKNEGYLNNIGKVSAEVMRRNDIPFLLSLGDLSTQEVKYDISVFDECMRNVLDTLSPIPQKNLIITVGNHDGAIGTKEAEPEPINYRYQLNNEQRSEIFFDWQRTSNPEKIFSSDGTYYYIDDANTKTRYIMLNSFWSEWEGDPVTGYVEDIQHAFMQTPIYGQEQLSWFANEALNMPKGYRAIIGTHHALAPLDYKMFKGIVDAYVEKDKFSGSYTGAQEWQNSSIEVNYSSVKGEIIAIFQGHDHQDTVDTETFAVPCITVTTAGAYFAVRDKNPEERILGTTTETSLDIVTVDTENEVIYITKIGAGSDMRIEY